MAEGTGPTSNLLWAYEEHRPKTSVIGTQLFPFKTVSYSLTTKLKNTCAFVGHRIGKHFYFSLGWFCNMTDICDLVLNATARTSSQSCCPHFSFPDFKRLRVIHTGFDLNLPGLVPVSDLKIITEPVVPIATSDQGSVLRNPCGVDILFV